MLLTLVACAPAEERFPERYADAVCARWHDCDRDGFDALYDDPAACRDDWTQIAEDHAVGEGDYARRRAADCLQAIRRGDCGAFSSLSFLDECEDIWQIDTDVPS